MNAHKKNSTSFQGNFNDYNCRSSLAHSEKDFTHDNLLNAQKKLDELKDLKSYPERTYISDLPLYGVKGHTFEELIELSSRLLDEDHELRMKRKGSDSQRKILSHQEI